MGTRALDDLSSDFKPIVCLIVARLVERGGAWMYVNILRSQAEQDQNIATNHSWVKLSKHLPRRLRGFAGMTVDAEKSDAIDLVPFSQWLEFGEDKLQWNADDPMFAQLGAIAETCPSVRWGGRWAQKDMGHIELLLPGETYKDIPQTAAAFGLHGVQA